MPRSGVPTGRIAVPVSTVTIPGGERTFVSNDPRFGPTTVDIPPVTFRAPGDIFGGVPIDPGGGLPPLGVTDVPMYSSGFSYGGFSPSAAPASGMFGQILQAGTDIITSIINRGSAAAASPQVTTAGGGAGSQRIATMQQLPPVERADLPVPVVQGQVMGWPTTKDGRPRRVRRDGKPWKRPTMNPANPRALGRAMRRVNGFASIAKRTISFTKRVKMKKRKRT